ncbi:MAG: ABC transporter permease [Acidimicrobiia bacterium]
MRAALRRVIQLAVVLLCVSFFSFGLLSLAPGDPVVAIVGFASPQQLAAVRHQLHFDRPFLVQYWSWLSGFLRGNLGYQYFGPTSVQKVSTALGHALPVSLQLMAYAMILTVLIAIPLGVLAAYKSGTWLDKVINLTAFGSLALPDFALALILSYWVGVKLHWLPSQGYVYPSQNFVSHLKHMLLPALSLAVGQTAAYMRLLRSDMISTLQEDFILMAKAKGITNRRILWRHALRPSSLTLLTVAGLNVGALIGGTIVIEVIFQLPGMGLLLFSAIEERQFVMLQSLVAVIAVGYVLVNILIDTLYSILDPRLRHARAIA